MKEEEQRERGTHRSLVDGGGTAATSVREEVQSPSSVAKERCGGGGVVDRDVGRRRSVGVGGEQVDRGGDAVPLFFVPAVERRRQRSRGGRRWWGGKKRSLPLPPYLYAC
jgi:hypothetical protein